MALNVSYSCLYEVLLGMSEKLEYRMVGFCVENSNSFQTLRFVTEYVIINPKNATKTWFC